MSDTGLGKILPNLKVTLGKDKSDSEISLEPGELLDETIAPSPEMSKQEIIQKWMKTMNSPKEYRSKLGGFETGLDLSAEVLLQKLEARAERFGLDETEQKPITQVQINALYKSLELDPENLKSSCKNIRLGVIHMRGVSDMNTKQVIAYFKDYGPSAVEWINDVSCNVCWHDETSAARALLGMSQPFVIKRKSKKLAEEKELSDSDVYDKEMLGKTAVIEVSDSEEDETQAKELPGRKVKLSDLEEIQVEAKTENESDQSDSKEDCDMEVDDKNKSDGEVDCNDKSATPDIPVPPGYWRLGVPHPKAKAVLLRFATKDDKKLPGAEKRSRYYQKYGNPNYGGLKGLISSSRKRKFQATRTHQMVEKLSGNKPATRHSLHTSEYLKRTKMPRMKMYADEEEERIKERGSSSRRVTTQSRGVKSRLGERYTQDDLHQLGHGISSDEDAIEETIPIVCKIPSRYSIWTDQAKAMAEEDTSIPQVYKFQNFAFGSERALHETLSRYNRAADDEDLFLDQEQSDRYCAYSSERADYNNERQYGFNRHRGDLRDALNSSHKKNAPKSDLRSRIQKIKEDETPKHRSPLCIDSD